MRAAQITAPATEDARRWQGWGTALKPAHEPIVVARKPLSGTVAATVLAHGTGALNVDGCRVGTSDVLSFGSRAIGTAAGIYGKQETPKGEGEQHAAGRWPANVLFTHAPECADDGCAPGCPVAELDAQSGPLSRGRFPAKRGASAIYGGGAGLPITTGTTERDLHDTGGASRFFPVFRYQAKAPTKERPKIDGQGWPTVKPLALMRWLARLLTPPGGLVVDPFAGTSATLQAAELEGFDALGMERDELAYRLSCARLGLHHSHVPDPDGAPELAQVPAPRVELVAEPEPDPVLVAIGAARSDAELTAVWAEHADRWTDEYTAAARARLADLEVAA